MSKEKPAPENTFSPQYFIISKSEPQYELIKTQLLDTPHHQSGSSHYFIRTCSDKGCVCRIRPGNGTVLFYEIINHLKEGISDEDIRETLADPANASPLPGYFYLPTGINTKLQAMHPPAHSCDRKAGKEQCPS